MSRLFLGSVILVALGGSASADPYVDDMAELPMAMALGGVNTSPVAANVTLYLNRDGGTITGGWDDSASSVSSIAMNASGGVADVPAWAGSTRAWNKVVACTKDRFAPFNVSVVTERPRSGEYVMIMVGGHPSMFGYPNSVSGVAPYTGDVVRGAVGYVFSASIDEDVDTTCVSVVHEAGHTLGLDHEYLCEDPMSYLWGCGEKRFRDVEAPCGEDEERTCGNGDGTQNSYRLLAAHVGLKGEPAPEPEPEPEVEDDPPYDDGSGWGTDDDYEWGDDAGDAIAPTVQIDAEAEESIAGNQWIEITVRASDDGGVSDVELGWASETSQYVISCASPPEDMPVACTRDGDEFRFQLYVGTGWRAMAARATDASGNQSITDYSYVYLED